MKQPKEKIVQVAPGRGNGELLALTNAGRVLVRTYLEGSVVWRDITPDLSKIPNSVK